MHWIRRHRTGRPPHPDVLTPAEWRVLEHVREGLPNAEIAVRLGVSINTVRTHVSSMLAKLELPDRHALARWQGEPADASRHHLERTRVALPFPDWGSLARVAAGVAVGATAAAVLWLALGNATDGGPSEDGDPGIAPSTSMDLTEGNPPGGAELLAAASVEVGDEVLTITGERSSERILVDIALPPGMELLGGPSLLHRGNAIAVVTIERTPEGVTATFPPTASGADLHLDLGPAVRVRDGEPIVITIAVGDAWRRAGIDGRCPPRDHANFAIEPGDIAVGHPDLVAAGDCGWHYLDLTPSREVLGVTFRGTWHSEHGLMREGNWPAELSVSRDDPIAVERATTDPGSPDGPVTAFDQAGAALSMSGTDIGYARGTDGRLSWGETTFRFVIDELTEMERVTLLIGVEPASIIEGDHTAILVGEPHP